MRIVVAYRIVYKLVDKQVYIGDTYLDEKAAHDHAKQVDCVGIKGQPIDVKSYEVEPVRLIVPNKQITI